MAIYLGSQIVGSNHVTGDGGSPGGSSVTVSPLSITANGTYTAPEGSAYSPIDVDINFTAALRPDAELIKTWSYDEKAVDDWELTLPSYSTSAQTIRATQNLSETYTIDNTNYDWYLVERFLAIPEYNITTVGKGRVEYNIGAGAYELLNTAASSFSSKINPSLKYNTGIVGWISTGTNYRSIYYSSNTAITAYSTATYTVGQTIQAPGYSSNVLTIKTPSYTVRGSSSYFTSTYFNAITDIRYQFIAELYRAPKVTLLKNGWLINQQTARIIDSIQNNNWTLR